jgi:hypothetical protein
MRFSCAQIRVSPLLLNLCIIYSAAFCFSATPQRQRVLEKAPAAGYWSEQTVLIPNTWIYPAFEEASVTVISPDHRNNIRSEGTRITATLEGNTVPVNWDDKSDVEVGWAPDSTRFFITWSDGGLVGRWHVQVFDVSKRRLKEIKGIEYGPRHEFEQFVRTLPRPADTLRYPESVFWNSAHYCYSNLAGITWLNGSSQLLLRASVNPEGDCKFSGKSRKYRIAVPSGKILQRYQAEDTQ